MHTVLVLNTVVSRRIRSAAATLQPSLADTYLYSTYRYSYKYDMIEYKYRMVQELGVVQVYSS